MGIFCKILGVMGYWALLVFIPAVVCMDGQVRQMDAKTVWALA